MSNLRIKNKRLRRELERLKNQTVKLTTIYDQPNIIKLGAVINFPNIVVQLSRHKFNIFIMNRYM